MDKSGFKPAWMKINSTDKINENEKILHDRSLNSIESLVQGVRISTRQRHHSSTQNDQIGTRYGSTSHPFQQYQRSYSREISKNFHSKTSDQQRLHSSSSIQNNDEIRPEDFSSRNDDDESPQNFRSFGSNRIFRRKERLASAPTNIDESRSIFPKPSHFLQTFKNDLSIERVQVNGNNSTSTAEKEFFEKMGWTETDQHKFYQITEQDRENYEKRRQMMPKSQKRSAELLFALHRRSLPSINIHHLLQSNNADIFSDDDENSDE